LTVTGEKSASPVPFVPETTVGADRVAEVGFAERFSETEIPDRGWLAASRTATWIGSALGAYATLEIFCGVPLSKAESVGPRPVVKATLQLPDSGVDKADDGSFGRVVPLKAPLVFATRVHPVEADVVHGAVAVNETVRVVDVLAAIPRPWICVDETRVTPACEDESTDAIDHPEGAVRLKELA